MAESTAESDGHGHRDGPRGKSANRIDIHRVNDFLLGHVGQVSYHPRRDDDESGDEADIGDLSVNRITEQPPSFRKLLSSEKWFPPTKTSLDVHHEDIARDTRSHRSWLLKTHPEAFFGNDGLKVTISEELRAFRSHGYGAESPMGSVLAVGEIVDLRNPPHILPRPAVAMPAGEAGHILRVSLIELEKWMWVEAESSLLFGAMQSQFHGSWCSDGTPISKIRFITKERQYDPIRWLITQKSTFTTILQPEIQAKPVADAAQGAIPHDAGLHYIALIPIVTLPAKATGGDAHSDFSVNIGSEAEAPQIAIIDRSGNWSVWFIDRARNHHEGSRIHRAVPKNRGTCELSPSTWPPNRIHPSGNFYRISWVRQAGSADSWERDRNPLVESDFVSRPLQPAYLTRRGVPDTKYDGLLICNNNYAQVIDVGGLKVHFFLDFFKRHGADMLLDAQVLEGCPSHIAVLTIGKLYLLDIGRVTDREASKPKILISCPHFRNQAEDTLKMSVVRLQSTDDQASSLVLLYSGQDVRVQLFWLTISHRGGCARFHHQTVHCPGFHTSPGEPTGIASLHAVPLQLSASRSHHGSESETGDDHMTGHKLQAFQLFCLANDMGLMSSVVLIGSGTAEWLGSPKKLKRVARDGIEWTRFLRRKQLRELDTAFVVPDVAEEHRQLGHDRSTKGAAKHTTFQLRYYLVRVMREINEGFFGKLDSAGDNRVGPFDVIQEVLENREADQHIALQPLQQFAESWGPLDLTELDVLWGRNIERLRVLSNVRLLQCGPFGPNLDVLGFFERFSVDWSGQLAAESLTATQWRYMQLALERMAAEVYLSEKLICMAPQSTLDLVSKTMPLKGDSQPGTDDMFEELPFSQAESDITLPTPSVTPSSSRATSQAAGSVGTEEQDDITGQEDPVVSRLRMYLPSIRFTPPAKKGQSRVVSLWPERRGSDPWTYIYWPIGKGSDPISRESKRRREKEEDRRRRKAERRAQLGVKLEGIGDSFGQPLVPNVIQSSPPPQLFSKSPNKHQTLGFKSQSQAQSQSQSQSQTFGPSQTMSQPLRGEFGTRQFSKLGRKIKGKQRVDATLGKPGFK